MHAIFFVNLETKEKKRKKKKKKKMSLAGKKNALNAIKISPNKLQGAPAI